MVAKSEHETKHNVADGLTKTVIHRAKEHVDHTENREPTHEHVSMNLIVIKSIQNELMGEQKSTPAARDVNPSTGHMNVVEDEKEILENWCGRRDALSREHINSTRGVQGVNPRTGHKSIVKDCRESWHKSIVRVCRENWHKSIVRDCPENMRNIVMHC